MFLIRVEIPVNNPNLNIDDSNNKKYITNMIILCEKYEWNNIEEILRINENNYECLLRNACNAENIIMLETLLKKYKHYSENLIIEASKNNKVKILKWFKQNGYKIKINNCVDYAIIYGNIDVLKWYMSVDVIHIEHAINLASKFGKINILDYIKNSEYDFNYEEIAINNASENGHIHVLDWFKNNDLEIKYNENAVNYASKNGHVQVLEWFKKNNYDLKYTKNAFNYASEMGHVQILDWFKINNYKLKYNKTALINACFRGHIHVLEWFKNNGYEFKNNENNKNFVRYAYDNDNTNVLNWFKLNFNICFEPKNVREWIHVNKIMNKS